MSTEVQSHVCGTLGRRRTRWRTARAGVETACRATCRGSRPSTRRCRTAPLPPSSEWERGTRRNRMIPLSPTPTVSPVEAMDNIKDRTQPCLTAGPVAPRGRAACHGKGGAGSARGGERLAVHVSQGRVAGTRLAGGRSGKADRTCIRTCRCETPRYGLSLRGYLGASECDVTSSRGNDGRLAGGVRRVRRAARAPLRMCLGAEVTECVTSSETERQG